MRTYSLAVFFLILLILPTEARLQDLPGKELFRNYCKACHNLEQRLVGPPLLGVHERRDSQWLVSFIKNSQAMIESGDAYAVELYNDYNKVIMPAQNLTDPQISDILAYIRAESESVGQVAANPIPRPVEPVLDGEMSFRFSNYIFWIPYTIVLILLLIALHQCTVFYDLWRKKAT